MAGFTNNNNKNNYSNIIIFNYLTTEGEQFIKYIYIYNIYLYINTFININMYGADPIEHYFFRAIWEIGNYPLWPSVGIRPMPAKLTRMAKMTRSALSIGR